MTPRAGADRYRLVRELGRGSMGVVYEAFDEVRGAPVAIKHLDRLDAAHLIRFKREFRSRADLVHPNLVTLHELVGADDVWFFVMDLVDGVDLAAWLADERPVGGTRLRAALRQLCAGLGALHAAGLVHRDLKPSNVRVTPEGRVVILDFGLVAQAGRLESDASVVGTPDYLAPETVTGEVPTGAADAYALGVMLYEALTGRLPFDGPPLQVLLDKAGRDPPPPRAASPEVPADLDELCVALLARDPAARPALADVARRVAGPRRADSAHDAAATAPGDAHADATPLFGRHRELAALAAAGARLDGGRGGVVLVRGASGIGKTRLVRHFLDGLRDRPDVLVLAGRCYERESVPYPGADSLIDALASHLATLPPDELAALLPDDAAAIAQLFPVLRRLPPLARGGAPARADDPQRRRRAVFALRALLRRLAARHRVVAFIDDLQWGDADGAAVLADLTREPEPPPLLLVCALRREAGPDHPVIAALAGRAGAALTAIDLPPLPPDDMLALARALVEHDGSADPRAAARAAAIAREAGGHPLLAHELAHHAPVEPERDAAGLDDAPTDTAPGVTLDHVIRARLRRLPDDARRLLELIAAAGRPLPLAVVERAAGAADAGAAAALSAARLIRGHGARSYDRVEPYHDHIRAAVVASVLDRLPALHGRLAAALEATGHGDPETLALLWRGAGEPARAAHYTAEAAARAAEALAFHRAAELYELALVLDPAPRPDRAHALRLGLAHALASGGHGERAAEAYTAAAATAASRLEAVELQRLAAEQLLRVGQLRAGIERFEEVFRATGVRYARSPRRALISLGVLRARIRLRGLGFRTRPAAALPPEALARIDTCWTAASGLGFSDVIRGAEMQARGLLLALAAGEPARVCRALSAEACFRATYGGEDDRDVVAILDQAEALARQLDDAHGLAMCGLAAMLSAYCRGRWAATIDRAAPTIDLFATRCTGAYWETTSTRHLRHWALAYAGRFRELEPEVAALLDDAATAGDVYASNYLRTGMTNLVWLARDEPALAHAQVTAAVEEWPGEGFQMQHYNALQARVHIDLYLGRPADAGARIAAAWDDLGRSQLRAVQQIRIELAHLQACVALADPAGHGEARRWARRIRREQMRWGEPLAALIEAPIAAAGGDRAGAAARLRAAAAGFAAAGMEVHRGIAQWRLAALLGGDDGAALRDAAAARLDEAGVREPEAWARMWAPGW